MKKIISFLLLAAMLIGCIVPAGIVSAADCAIAAESVEVLEGNATANASISISGNTGFAYAQFAVVFKSAELEAGEATSTVFDTVSVKNIRAKDLGNYIPEGADAAEYAGFYVSLENESFEDVAANGKIADLAFNLVAPAVGATYNYYVTVVEACDTNEDEVVIGGELVEGAIAVVKDENLGKYDDFTLFFAPEEVEIEVGNKANVDLRVDANPGLWSIRCMIVYPAALSLDADEGGLAVVENGSIFADSDLNRGIANLPLTDDRLLAKYAEYFDANGIAKEGYNSAVLYFEPEAYDAVISGNGVLASLAFNTDNCVEGESYDINVYYVVGDIFRAEGQTFIDLFPATVGTTIKVPAAAGACEHANVTVKEVPATCTEAGSKTTVCNDCGETIATEEIAATGHAYGETVEVVAPTCTTAGTGTQTCANCGDVVEIEIPATGHTAGEVTCGEAQVCTVCGEVIADAAPHTPGEAVVVPATCTEDGSRTINCSVCGELISTEVIEAPGHNYLQPGSTVIVPPTCTEGGYTQKTCQVCGDVAIMDETEPDGHSYVDGKCEVCGAPDPDAPIAPEHTIIHFDAVEPGCHYNGNIEYWFCSDCESFWADEALTQLTNSKNVILPALGGDVVHFDAIEPACHYAGNIEFWFCPECEQYWQDSALTQLTNAKNVILPATGSENVQHVEAVEPTCASEGNIEYWFCADCEQFWQDEALTQLTNSKNVIIGTTEHSLIHFDAIAPACHYDGQIEYWFCSACEGFWADEALTQVTNSKSVVLPALGSDALMHVEADEATCEENGNIEYWFCPECEQYWQDAALTQLTNIKNVIIPGGHVLTHFDAVEPGCHYLGNIEYWFCSRCECFWQDEALTQLTNSKNVILPALGSENVVHIEAVEPGCHYLGNIEYWYCPDCEQFWQDEALTQLTNSKNVILPELGSEELEKIDAVAPTCTSEGNIEYWHCGECDQYWADEARTQLTNVKNVILPATGHELVHFDAVEPACHYNGNIEYWFCSACECFWQDEALTQLTNSKNVILPAVGSEKLIHVEAIEPACHYAGNIEYWFCPDCEQYWADEALTQLTNSKNVILPALGSENLVHFDAVEPACHYAGNIEYWFCPDCEQYWQDAALTQLTNAKNVILPAVGSENIIHFEAIEPACHYVGNIEYWYCADCGQFWQDEALTQLTNAKNVVLPAIGSDNVEHVAAVAPTCTSEGNIEYWHCADCDQYWQDAALTQLTNAKNVILLAPHTTIHFDAVEPACHYNGNIEYWYCSECDGFWADEALTQVTNSKNVILPAIGGEVVHFDAVEPACHYNGNIEYWFCAECEQFWADEALTQLTNSKNVILPAVGGEVVHFDAIEPACHYDGQIEYWFCPECEQFWADEALTQVTNSKSVVLPATGSENVQHVAAAAPSCYEEGQIEYWFCPDCDQFWQDEALTQLTNAKRVILPAAHAPIHFEAVEPGCHYNGNIEYWFCADCESFWADEALTQVTNSKSVVVPATGSENLIHVDAVAPACHYAGNIEYWFCPDCEQFWADEALTQLTNSKNVVLPALGGELVHFDAVAPACHYNGNIEYWFCADCEQFWADEALTQLTNSKNVILPALGGEVVHFDAVAPSCHYDGNIEYWFCADCEQYWADEALTQLTNSKNVILPAVGGEVVHFDAIAPACHYNGNIEYWFCAECEQFWADEALTQLTNSKNVVLPATCSENVVHFDAVEPGCHYNGNIEYWYCPDCDQFFADEAHTQITNALSVVLPATGSENLKHVEAVAPTCTEDGNVEYWFCADCEQFWADEALTQLTNSKNVVVPATGHNFVDGECDCGETDGTVEPSKPTGDNMMWIIIALAVVAMGSVAIVVIRRRRNAQ